MIATVVMVSVGMTEGVIRLVADSALLVAMTTGEMLPVVEILFLVSIVIVGVMIACTSDVVAMVTGNVLSLVVMTLVVTICDSAVYVDSAVSVGSAVSVDSYKDI